MHLRIVENKWDSAATRDAQFEVDELARIQRFNWRGSELLISASLFENQSQSLLPIEPSSHSYWMKSLKQCQLDKRPKLVLLQSKDAKTPVMLESSSQSTVTVRVVVESIVTTEVFDILCTSLRITQAEQLVLHHLTRGLQPKLIAKLTNRTESTVRSHIKMLLSKSQCTSMQELITVFLRMPDISHNHC
jgi:DNA-binding NarL/FixJ family response regulator